MRHCYVDDPFGNRIELIAGEPPGRVVSLTRSPLPLPSLDVSSMSPQPPERVVAAFDFDGTLSTRDNFMPFLKLVAGARAIGSALAAVIATQRRPVGRKAWSAGRDQGRGVRRLFTGRDAARLDKLARGLRLRRHAELPARRDRRAGRLAPHPGPPSS